MFFFFFFFPENVGSLKTQNTPQKIQKTQRYDGGKKKSVRVGRGTLNTCETFQGITLKNGVDIDISRSFGFDA